MKIKALVADNNPVLLKAVSTILKQEGCHVLTAENGLEAIDIAKKEVPDIIFTDLIMPLVGGEQLCRIIRSSDQLHKTFIVILSAVVHEEKERILTEIDYDVCIAKGSLKELRQHLQEALLQFKKRESIPKTILGDTSEVSGKDKSISNVARELLSEKHHLKEMLENLNEGIVELSKHGVIVSINRAAVNIFKTPMEKLIGVRISALAWETYGSKISIWEEEDLIQGRGQVLEIPDSEPLVINSSILTAYFLPIQKKASGFAVCILRDITRQYLAEKKKIELENALHLVNKMEAMSCMAGGVAHDFNNLLTAICGNLDMISLQTGEPEVVEENQLLIKNAKEAAHLTVNLVRKISCFSPFGIIQRDRTSINDLIEDVVVTFSNNKKKINISVESLNKDSLVNIDAQQIKIAIINILQNSLEAGKGSEIKISLKNILVESPMAYSGQFVSPGKYIKIVISDKGRGISAHCLPDIFDPYYSTKERGTRKGMGLGLTIVYQTLRNHGGHVIVESQSGKGTDVSLFLPVFKLEPVLAKGEIEEEKKILLCEDDDQLRFISKIMLEYLGYQPFEATDKEEAIEILQQNLKKELKISVAIVNLMGSGQQRGVEICQEMHKIDKYLKVIVSSGLIQDPVMINFREYGFSNYLYKPYTLDDLKKVLSTL